MNYYTRGFTSLPPVVKNLILINLLVLLAYYVARFALDIDLNTILGIYFPKSEMFQPFQIVTHMFAHGGVWHLFFNMFALFMFGRVLETVWGPKRFLIYYLVTGLGAALVHETVMAIQYTNVMAQISPEQLQHVLDSGALAISQNSNFVDPVMAKLNHLLNVPTVGASGAVFGILLAFGVLFPNTQLMLLLPPIPIKAKYFVIIYGAIELYLAVTQPGSNIAHAAHLGGMLFGYILIRIWRKTTKTLY